MRRRTYPIAAAFVSVALALSPCLLSINAAAYTSSDLVFGSYALGREHCLAVNSDGSLYTWGDNSLGQLGNGGGGSVSEPTAIALTTVDKAAACGGNSLAITDDGSLYTWGFNTLGQVGNGTAENRLSPYKVLENVASAALGDNNTAAITENGSLYVWGHNTYGQVGIGTTEKSYTVPKLVSLPSQAASVAVGMWHTAAVTQTGDLYVWGCDTDGQVGDGDEEDAQYFSNKTGVLYREPDQLMPTKVMAGVAFVVVYENRTAAVTSDGSLYMWGDNSCGQLGDGTQTTSFSPVLVEGVSNVASVVLGVNNTAAITESGDLYVWGDNSYGQLGNGTTVSSYVPQKLMGNVASAAICGLHMGAVTKDGRLFMWGSDGSGQVGDGAGDIITSSYTQINTETGKPEVIEFSYEPDQSTPVGIMTDIGSLILEENRSAALDIDGRLYIWGFVSGERVSSPVQVMEEVALPFGDNLIDAKASEPNPQGMSTVTLPEISGRVAQGDIAVVQADGECFKNADGTFMVDAGQNAYVVAKNPNGEIIDAVKLSITQDLPNETEALICDTVSDDGALTVTGIIGSGLNCGRYVAAYTAVYSEAGRLLSLSGPEYISLDSPATVAKVRLNVRSWTEGCTVKLMVLTNTGSLIPLCAAGEYVSNSN